MTDEIRTTDLYLRVTMREAEVAARSGNRPFGAVILDPDGRVVISEHNRVMELSDPSAHAELMAIRELCRRRQELRLDGFTLYANAQPCPMCFALMVRVGITELYFGAPSEPDTWPAISMEELASRYGAHRIRWHGGILGDEASEQLSALSRAY